ncbi:MAG: HD domain-containing protein [Patescibacteria group bacterium]|nr:HD domain-containing protein [Patescibacteria group bacterium]
MALELVVPFGREYVLNLHDSRVATVARALDGIQRTGWVRRNVTNPETDLQHTHFLMELAKKFRWAMRDIDFQRLLCLLAVHEWPEAIDGDPVTAMLSGVELAAAIVSKHESETAAMRIITARFGEDGPSLMALWQEYEAGETSEAAFARQLDKLADIVMAWRYECEGDNDVRAIDFWRTNRPRVSHPALVAYLEPIRQRIFSEPDSDA